MKKLILSLAVALVSLSGFSQDYEQMTREAFAKHLSPYFDDISISYTKGLFTSIGLEFELFGSMRTLYIKNCPKEVTGLAVLQNDEYTAAKKGASAIRKLLLEEARTPKGQTSVYVGRMLSGISPMIFRVYSKTNENQYFDIKITDEEIFGVPFDQVDKKQVVRTIVDYLNEVHYNRPLKILHLSEDGNWLIDSYKRSGKYYRQDEAFQIAQKKGSAFYPATNRKYFADSDDYTYIVAPFGMGIMVEVSNQDAYEVSREWITPEEIREFCLEEGHKFHGLYDNTWFLKLPGFKNAAVREYSDAFGLELWCTWYDVLGGEWTVERIKGLIQQCLSDPDSPMREIIAASKSTGKPFYAVLNSRFGLRFTCQVEVE